MTVRKDRLPEVKLFKDVTVPLTFQRLTSKLESNRMDKVFIKKLEQLNDEVRNWRGTNRNNKMEETLTEAMKYLLDNRNLWEWAKRKGIKITKTDV